tara:strand:- start:398 stop:604 length:207 start_codon:yes stop_codon:yes gene_type:complete
MKGLGDSIEKFTKATGIHQIVDKVTGGGCGCAKRKKKLNTLFPYTNKNKITYHGISKTPNLSGVTSNI